MARIEIALFVGLLTACGAAADSPPPAAPMAFAPTPAPVFAASREKPEIVQAAASAEVEPIEPMRVSTSAARQDAPSPPPPPASGTVESMRPEASAPRPSDDSQLGGTPKVPMTKQVGGFAFGITRAQFRRTCASAQLQIGELTPGPNGELMCTGLPVDIGFKGLVGAKFKQDRAIEFEAYLNDTQLEQFPRTFANVEAMLSEKYGSPNSDRTGSAEDFTRRCSSAADIRVRRSWTFSDSFGPNFELGRIVLYLTCKQSTPRLMLLFDDKTGFEAQVRQDERVRANY